MIERTFRDISEENLKDSDNQSFLVNLGWSKGISWTELLKSKRVLIISEAGAGKTYECRQQVERLNNTGEPAFMIELASLSKRDLRSSLDENQEACLDTWLKSQSEVATFFLDSIDELKLSLGSFEQALKDFKKGIKNQLDRVRIIITTRPTTADQKLVRDILPLPPTTPTKSPEETFALIAMGDGSTNQCDSENEKPTDWRTVALMPLSDAQIKAFAQGQNVQEPAALLEDLQRRNAEEFARRPQDLIELCADWRIHKRIRTHRDQVAANVYIKLQPREDRLEPAELSVDKATEGASRLALAMLLARRLTIRHSAVSDNTEDEATIDPRIVLADWSLHEQKALLERPLFGFASYGRVRFHHRSVAEYLAAERLLFLRGRGMPIRQLTRLLFAETKGKTIARPSKRPMAGWLALVEDRVFEILRDNEPAVLLAEGDPESLTKEQRAQTLRAYVQRYGQGGWRGLKVPGIQIHRFASPELASEIIQLWNGGIENPDVREIILEIIEKGLIRECADIAYECVSNPKTSLREKMAALDAMIAIKDPRLSDISNAVVTRDTAWPDKIACAAMSRLFPRAVSAEQLCEFLRKIKKEKRVIGGFIWQLQYQIKEAELDLSSLELLRDGLVELVSCGLRWQDDWPYIVSDNQHLSSALAATCLRGLKAKKCDKWLHASVLALRLQRQEYNSDESYNALLGQLATFDAKDSCRLFHAADAFLNSINCPQDPWGRLSQIAIFDGPITLKADRDLIWIKNSLNDINRTFDDRAILLEAAILLVGGSNEKFAQVSQLKMLVADEPELLAVIDNWLKPSILDEAQERWRNESSERKKLEEQQIAENRTSWINFWQEIVNHPDTVFSAERSEHTAWNLWRVMKNNNSSGWNRHFIEQHFGEGTTNILRRTLMNMWRKMLTTAEDEKPVGEKNLDLVCEGLELTAIYAEAEDPYWATQLTVEEAELATRLAFTQLNVLPLWMENLVAAQPQVVVAVLNKVLCRELAPISEECRDFRLLRYIQSAPELIAKIFLPQLIEWLNTVRDCYTEESVDVMYIERLKLVIDIILRHGGEYDHSVLRDLALKNLELKLPDQFSIIWLSTLMRTDAELGVTALETRISLVKPEKNSAAVNLFARIFSQHQDAVNLHNSAFSPNLLLRLLRLAYQHVRIVDDSKHEGSYRPDIRDVAEDVRNGIVNILLKIKGEVGFAVKLEMSRDPACAHFKDRIIAVAEENWALEIDSALYNEAEIVIFEKRYEMPPSTNEMMFGVMKDRLADLDELLLSDATPRDLWAASPIERLMRRAIAGELQRAAHGLYRVNQEAVTGDEKETDIRLVSETSNHEAVIELKVADERSARDLLDTIENQLVNKYMAAENRRSGCLLITIAKQRNWEHPDSGKKIDLAELKSLLCDEATRVEDLRNGSVSLYVHVLDLRPRLATEKNA